MAQGMVADLNVHWGRTASGEDQPHAHVMLTMREVGPDGFGKKVRDWNRTRAIWWAGGSAGRSWPTSGWPSSGTTSGSITGRIAAQGIDAGAAEQDRAGGRAA